ncbi:hypothetical protein N781_16635 [Pontibacillus halophilus JSM 076056 = DSM 19796]|uniref:Uncharacterized protein n=1 Tax=Pontibacillus halophilus JSM 076056 = DSM 19796 TaxID=1385510 RepID=A0A0A5GH06_9BACI|nr:hypothetical protein [Pontibacillus halophilus]KGX92496.1 hypothetical protein N781_16635 [Pontibacillus halophilus JSM 076056 = DSM 19796]
MSRDQYFAFHIVSAIMGVVGLLVLFYSGPLSGSLANSWGGYGVTQEIAALTSIIVIGTVALVSGVIGWFWTLVYLLPNTQEKTPSQQEDVHEQL